MEGVGIAGIARWLPDGGSLLCCSLSDDGGSVQRNSSICGGGGRAQCSSALAEDMVQQRPFEAHSATGASVAMADMHGSDDY